MQLVNATQVQRKEKNKGNESFFLLVGLLESFVSSEVYCLHSLTTLYSSRAQSFPGEHQCKVISTHRASLCTDSHGHGGIPSCQMTTMLSCITTQLQSSVTLVFCKNDSCQLILVMCHTILLPDNCPGQPGNTKTCLLAATKQIVSYNCLFGHESMQNSRTQQNSAVIVFW